MSRDGAIALQPGQQEQNSISPEKRKKEKKVVVDSQAAIFLSSSGKHPSEEVSRPWKDVWESTRGIHVAKPLRTERTSAEGQETKLITYFII